VSPGARVQSRRLQGYELSYLTNSPDLLKTGQALPDQSSCHLQDLPPGVNNSKTTKNLLLKTNMSLFIENFERK
jgi:hypothetical protein